MSGKPPIKIVFFNPERAKLTQANNASGDSVYLKTIGKPKRRTWRIYANLRMQYDESESIARGLFNIGPMGLKAALGVLQEDFNAETDGQAIVYIDKTVRSAVTRILGPNPVDIEITEANGPVSIPILMKAPTL